MNLKDEALLSVFIDKLTKETLLNVLTWSKETVHNIDTYYSNEYDIAISILMDEFTQPKEVVISIKDFSITIYTINKSMITDKIRLLVDIIKHLDIKSEISTDVTDYIYKIINF